MDNDRLKYLNSREQEAVLRFVHTLKQTLGKELLSVTLFGSKARGDYSAESDIDILLVLRERTPVLTKNISNLWLEIDLEYDAKISFVIYSEHEFQTNLKLGSPFTANVQQEGITL
jgi:predicted nucleotidyltransferase